MRKRVILAERSPQMLETLRALLALSHRSASASAGFALLARSLVRVSARGEQK